MLDELTFGFPILSLLLFFPLLGAMVLWLIQDEDLLKSSSLGIAVLELILAGMVLFHFEPGTSAMQFTERVAWIPPLGISYHLAVDGISVLFVGLTALLTTLIILYSWDTVRHQAKAYFMALLAFESTMMGIFVSVDLILFFVFWELMLGHLSGSALLSPQICLVYPAGQRVYVSRHRPARFELSRLGDDASYRALLYL
jgi:NADH-quinone oxidoreductase subunit M